MNVGFYDKKRHSMVAVEPWTEDIQTARFASVKLSAIYQSGRHRMPSPVWCVWDEENASIFFLDDKPIGDPAILDSIMALMV